MASVFEGLSFLIQYDLFIALGTLISAPVGGLLWGLSYRSGSAGMRHGGAILYALSGCGLVVLLLLLVVNIFSTVSVTMVMAVASSWIGSASTADLWASVGRSIVLFFLSTTGLIGGILLQWLMKRKSLK